MSDYLSPLTMFEVTRFFISNTFISNAKLKLTKKQDTQYPETEISMKLSKSASEAILMRLYD